jgi:membrane protease YdiL (CAAX protease family)
VGRGDAAVHRRAAALIAASWIVTGQLSPRRAAIVAVLTTVLSVAAGFLAAASLSTLGLVGSSWLEPRSALRQILVVAASLVPLLVALRLTRAGLDSVGLTRTNLRRGVTVGGALAAGWLLLSGAFGDLLQPRVEHALVLIGAMSVGFSEEIVWRGYLQTRLIDWIGTRNGIVLATAIFTLSHVPQRLLAGAGGMDLVVQLVVLAILGGAFGVMQASTKNVILPGIVHTAIDWSARFSALGH